MNSPAQNNSTFLERAGLLTARDIPTIPVDAGQKRCTVGDWPNLATTDLTKLAGWAQFWPTANTAAVCLTGGICVMDADVPGLMSRIEQECGQKIPATLIVKSGGKGLPHVYFRHSERSSALGNRKAAGMFDFQANRKYVVGPGSVLENGGVYEVVTDAPLAEIPDWLVDWIEANSVGEKKANADVGEKRAGPPLDSQFDFDEFLEHYGIDVVRRRGDWHITETCPVAGVTHSGNHETGFYYDGKTLGWNCFDTDCPGSSMSIGDVIKHLNKPGAPYAGPIWASDASRNDAVKVEGTPVVFNPWEYALQPLPDHKFSGWFPRGRLTVISGPSGSMKSSFMAQSLLAGRDGEPFLGHAPGKLGFFFLFADRGKWDAEETFQRMDMVGKIPYECINGHGQEKSLERIAAIAESGNYQILFIDGGDLLVGDNNDGEAVGSFTTQIQQLAEHYGVGFIISTGSGKMIGKQLQDGAERRSITKGSEVWGRTSGSIFTLNSETHDGTKSTRRLVVQHRNAPSESFLLDVRDGRLVQVDETKQMEAEADKRMLEWICQQDDFTRAQFVRQFPKLSGATVGRRLAALTAAGLLKPKPRGSKIVYVVREVNDLQTGQDRVF